MVRSNERLAPDLIRASALDLFYTLTFNIPSTLHPLDAAAILAQVREYLEREEDQMKRLVGE